MRPSIYRVLGALAAPTYLRNRRFDILAANQQCVAGDLTLTGDAIELPGEDLILITYTAPADSPAQQQLDLLASWAASRTNEGISGEESANSFC